MKLHEDKSAKTYIPAGLFWAIDVETAGYLVRIVEADLEKGRIDAATSSDWVQFLRGVQTRDDS